METKKLYLTDLTTLSTLDGTLGIHGNALILSGTIAWAYMDSKSNVLVCIHLIWQIGMRSIETFQMHQSHHSTPIPSEVSTRLNSCLQNQSPHQAPNSNSHSPSSWPKSKSHPIDPLVPAHLTRRHEKGSRKEATHQGPGLEGPIAGLAVVFGWGKPRAFYAEPPLVEEASGWRVALSVLVHGLGLVWNVFLWWAGFVFTIGGDSIAAEPPSVPNFLHLQMHGRVRAELNRCRFGL
jgi:hypothetical protein